MTKKLSSPYSAHFREKIPSAGNSILQFAVKLVAEPSFKTGTMNVYH